MGESLSSSSLMPTVTVVNWLLTNGLMYWSLSCDAVEFWGRKSSDEVATVLELVDDLESWAMDCSRKF